MILIMLYQWVNNRNIRQSQGVNMKKKVCFKYDYLNNKNRKQKGENLKRWGRGFKGLIHIILMTPTPILY